VGGCSQVAARGAALAEALSRPDLASPPSSTFNTQIAVSGAVREGFLKSRLTAM
jgi:hypothetical protein